jgi:hypothetical protein
LSEDTASRAETATTEEGCQIDWSWLAGREVATATSGIDKMTITFRDGQVLTIQASVWKGESFLAFNPWKAPNG